MSLRAVFSLVIIFSLYLGMERKTWSLAAGAVADHTSIKSEGRSLRRVMMPRQTTMHCSQHNIKAPSTCPKKMSPHYSISVAIDKCTHNVQLGLISCINVSLVSSNKCNVCSTSIIIVSYKEQKSLCV